MLSFKPSKRLTPRKCLPSSALLTSSKNAIAGEAELNIAGVGAAAIKVVAIKAYIKVLVIEVDIEDVAAEVAAVVVATTRWSRRWSRRPRWHCQPWAH